MARPRVPVVATLALAASLVIVLAGRPVLAAADTLPSRLTDEEFWQLSQDLSEPNGYFRSDNLLSNELYYPEILPLLGREVPVRVGYASQIQATWGGEHVRVAGEVDPAERDAVRSQGDGR